MEELLAEVEAHAVAVENKVIEQLSWSMGEQEGVQVPVFKFEIN